MNAVSNREMRAAVDDFDRTVAEVSERWSRIGQGYLELCLNGTAIALGVCQAMVWTPFIRR